MVCLNDYLYSGDTVLKILNQFTADLKESAVKTHNPVDMAHCNVLLQLTDILLHNDFLTQQSHKIRELYIYMTRKYPFLAFTFKGRIKSLIRTEKKINGYIVEFIYDYYKQNRTFPSDTEIKNQLLRLKDIIAYRIVISLPKCHLDPGESREQTELKYLYEIANIIPDFFEERGFTAEPSGISAARYSDMMSEEVRPYYRDYIVNGRPMGYQSLHVTLYDNLSRCFAEIQLRTKDMDDNAEIGDANHFGYERIQEIERARRGEIPVGACVYFDEAYEREQKLQDLKLSELDVNMFKAMDNYRINDGCGLFRGRQILPFEHLSRFQSDPVS